MEHPVEGWMEEDFGERTDAGSVECHNVLARRCSSRFLYGTCDSNELGSSEFVDRWRSLAAADGGDSSCEDRRPADRVEDEGADEEPTPLAVVERDLPGHLFGFTRRGSSHVVVNRRLYRVDRERTVRHEKTHHRHPDGEMTIRYINGDPDVRHTLSFQGNNPGKLGSGSRGISRTGVAAYGDDTGSAERYGVDHRYF